MICDQRANKLLSEKDKNLDIQIIRAIAIMLVIAQHIRTRLPSPPAYNDLFNHVLFWPGVDIFFAISGYLICKTFHRDLAHSATKIAALSLFWKRRIARLLPAVIVWAILSVVVSTFTTSTADTNTVLVAKGAVAGILGASNIYWASCIQYALQCGSADYNAVTWSLSLEWQLYAVSTIIFAVLGFKRGAIVLTLGALILSALPAPSFSFPWVFRPQAFVIGAIMYIVTKKRPLHINSIYSALTLVAGLAICLLAPLNIPQPYMIPAISVGAGLCLLSALSGASLNAVLPSSLLEWIGARSYSIYLCHLPLILVTREVAVHFKFDEPTLPNFLLSLMIAGLLIATAGDLSYRYVELPFQRRMALRNTGNKGFVQN